MAIVKGFLVDIREANFISQSDKDMLIISSAMPLALLEFQGEFAAALLEAHGNEE